MTRQFRDAAYGWGFADLEGLATRIRLCDALSTRSADDDRVLAFMRARLQRLLAAAPPPGGRWAME